VVTLDLLKRELQANKGRMEYLTGQSSLSVHAGEHKCRPKVSDSLTTPIVQTATYWFQSTQQVIDYNEGRYQSHEYGRYGNPTVSALNNKLIALEGGPSVQGVDCLFSSSGMASVTNMLFALLPKDGHLVITSDCYRRTRQFIQTFLPKMGITHTVTDPSDLKTLKEVLETKKVQLYFSEMPTNPYLRCVDVKEIAELCHKHGCLVAIDSTFATPINFQPLRFNADLVLHSGTKFLAGHNDVMSGCVIGKSEIIAQIKLVQNIMGPVLDPHAAYLILRGAKTLSVRVKKANETAMELAKQLEKHPKIEKVHYPGLESHCDHSIAAKQMSGFGGVLSFEVKGDFAATVKFIDSLQIPYIAPSLGGVEALVEQPTVMSYWNLKPEERAEVGIKDSLIRYSCGLEEAHDLLKDICQALEKI